MNRLYLLAVSVILGLSISACHDVSTFDPCDGVLDCGQHGRCETIDGQPQCVCNDGYVSVNLFCRLDGDADMPVDGDTDGDPDGEVDGDPDGDIDVIEADPPVVGEELDLGAGWNPRSLSLGEHGVIVSYAAREFSGLDFVHFRLLDWDGESIVASHDHDVGGKGTDFHPRESDAWSSCGIGSSAPWALFWYEGSFSGPHSSALLAVGYESEALTVVDLTGAVFPDDQNPNPRESAIVGDEDGCIVVWWHTDEMDTTDSIYARRIDGPKEDEVETDTWLLLQGDETTWRLGAEPVGQEGNEGDFLFAESDRARGVMVGAAVILEDGSSRVVGQRYNAAQNRREWDGEGGFGELYGDIFFDPSLVTEPSVPLIGIEGPYTNAMKFVGLTNIYYLVVGIGDPAEPDTDDRCLYYNFGGVNNGPGFLAGTPVIPCNPNIEYQTLTSANYDGTEVPIMVYWEFNYDLGPDMILASHVYMLGFGEQRHLELPGTIFPRIVRTPNGNLMLRWLEGESVEDFEIRFLYLTADLTVIPGWDEEGLLVRPLATKKEDTYSNEVPDTPIPIISDDGRIVQVYEERNSENEYVIRAIGVSYDPDPYQ